MKRLVVIALFSVLLTGCVKQSDYDALVKEKEELEIQIDELQRYNDGYKHENEVLREEIKKLETENLKEQNNLSPSPTTTQENDDKTLFSKFYQDEKTNEMLGATVSLDSDGNKQLIVSYLPSDMDAEYPPLYEMKCFAFVGFAYDIVKSQDSQYIFTVTNVVSKEYSYCNIDIYRLSGQMVISTYDRDGTSHQKSSLSELIGNDTGGGDWIMEKLEDDYNIVETSSVLWLNDTCNQIAKDIEGIYP